MKILIIGGTGAIGKLIVPVLSETHEVITAGRNTGDLQVDISSAESIEAIFRQVDGIDACICAAGDSYTGSLETLTNDNMNIGLQNKAVGQANLVIIGQEYLNENGSFTLISGKMGDKPGKNATAKAMANGAVNSFVLAAAQEMSKGIRINVISPSKISEIPVKQLTDTYIQCIESDINGEIIRINY